MFLDILLTFSEGIYFVFCCCSSLLRGKLDVGLSVQKSAAAHVISLETTLPFALSVHFVFTECYLL